ncbi:MAG: beta-N-acetylhexosaminidase [Proteobacteria bacterium]|nr:beta-N-acetylhexosaminidase [Pseudomonadota bacterium]
MTRLIDLPLGSLMIDIAGTELATLDRERLCHPLVGGVILFSRNYASPGQLARLCAEIHGLRTPRLPIAVDHEGGRVQRFRDGFTQLPSMHRLGDLWDKDSAAARKAARGIGYVLAAELRARGVDLSFTPVLDLDYGRSAVIGERAFHRDPAGVVDLAGALIAGLHRAGMAACGKHFPGHGYVAADSHVAIPVDERSLVDMAEDMAPYRQLKLDGVMPAHVIYPRVDSRPAGFSSLWLKMLREEFKFDGVIFSDDLSMQGASVAGGIVERAEAAWQAGCDMLLVCNAPDHVGELLERWHPASDPAKARRIERLLPLQAGWDLEKLQTDADYQIGQRSIAALPA